MRFFPHDFGSENDDATDAIIAAYNSFLESLPDPVGPRIRNFHASQSLNTNYLDRIQIRPFKKEVALSLISGDLQRGYSLLTIHYKNAALVEVESHIRQVFGFRNADIRYDEFDLMAGDRFVHRMLMWPEHLGEFGILFDDFEVEQMPLAGREYVTHGERVELE